MANKKITDIYTDNPVAIDPGDLLEVTENTGTTPLTGAFKVSQLMNNRYKINPSVASNDLILAVTHEDGSAPSTDRPIYFKIGNSLRAATGALSVTKADATDWANLGSTELATKQADLFVYAVWNTNLNPDALDIFWSRIPYGRLYSDFSATTTNEKYAAINATAPAATDECINIGRFAATLSAGAGYVWTVPSFTNINLVHRPIFETRNLDFSPIWTAATPPAIVNGTLTGIYKINNDTLSATIRIVMGSSTTYGTGTYTLTVPFSSIAIAGITHIFTGSVYDNNVGFIYMIGNTFSGATLFPFTHGAGQISATVPITFAVSDAITLETSYPI